MYQTQGTQRQIEIASVLKDLKRRKKTPKSVIPESDNNIFAVERQSGCEGRFSGRHGADLKGE